MLVFDVELLKIGNVSQLHKFSSMNRLCLYGMARAFLCLTTSSLFGLPDDHPTPPDSALERIIQKVGSALSEGDTRKCKRLEPLVSELDVLPLKLHSFGLGVFL